VTSLLKGVGLGVIATLLSAAPPAWEAASVSPRSALLRSGLERKAERAVYFAAGAGILLLLVGGLLLSIPLNNLVISFLGTFLVIIGFALLAPLFTKLLMLLLPNLTGTVWGVLGRMAPRDVVKALSRTSIAVAALMIAVSVTIGVSLMVTSFRYTVIAWLDQTLQGDIYISPPTQGATQPTVTIEPAILSRIHDWPGIDRVDVLRATMVNSPSGPIHIAATDNPDLTKERQYLSLSTTPELVSEQIENGAVLVSEPLANRLNLPSKDGEIRLYADNREIILPIVGIYYDYASSQGSVLMTLNTYRRFWQDSAITAVALRLNENSSPEEISKKMEEELSPIQRLLVRPNQTLRDEVLEIFDRTFAITGALQFLAIVVAFIGILSALLSWHLDKQREIGILRSIGLTTRQMWRLILLESGLLGGAAGLLALPTGYTLALILIYIINKRSFGWTLQMQLEPDPFIQALVLSVLAALLASIYPAFKISRSATVEALRSE
jgi:putative ABC transport system permease protein